MSLHDRGGGVGLPTERRPRRRRRGDRARSLTPEELLAFGMVLGDVAALEAEAET